MDRRANRMVDGGEEWSRSLGDGGIGDATGTVPFDWKGRTQDSTDGPASPLVKIDSGIIPQAEHKAPQGSQRSAALASNNDPMAAALSTQPRMLGHAGEPFGAAGASGSRNAATRSPAPIGSDTASGAGARKRRVPFCPG